MDQRVAPLPSQVRAQLERLQCSPKFAGSVRLLAFLRFIVEETLNGGCGRSLKEAVIGNAVYGREPPYDPQIDSTVRVEAARLRRKLKEYYASDGQFDPVTISLPTGGYVPVFMINPVDEPPPSRAASADVGHRGAEKFGGTTITVMPIRNGADDADDDAYAEGLSDELAAGMARSPGVRAVSHYTQLHHGRRTDLSASELGVDAVLRVAVGRTGANVGVTIELCDHRGLVVWSERIDAPVADRAALRRRVCAIVLDRVRFDGCTGPDSVETLATILRARQLLDEQTPGALRVALELFSSVCRSAPEYARGHAGVADTYCDLFRLGLISRAMALAAAKPAALRALQIDPQSAEAHSALATVSSWLERGRMSAEANFEQALVSGDDARAARLYGMHLTQLSRDAEARAMFAAARSFGPNSVHQEIAETMSLYYARRHGALVAAWRNCDKRPRAAETAFYLGLAHVFAGEGAAGRPLAAELERTIGKRPDLMFARAELEAWLGEPRLARALLDEGGSEATHFACATLAAAVGNEGRCLDELDAAANRREYPTVWLRSDARFDCVRSASRFQRLIERLDHDQVELSYCGYLIDHDLCPRRFGPDCQCRQPMISR